VWLSSREIGAPRRHPLHSNSVKSYDQVSRLAVSGHFPTLSNSIFTLSASSSPPLHSSAPLQNQSRLPTVAELTATASLALGLRAQAAFGSC